MGTEGLAAAFATTRRVLANVTVDQLDDPTPCTSWNVRRLVNHLVGGAHWFEITTNAGASPDDDDTEDSDFTAGDMVAAYDTATAGALVAFGADGALDRIITLPFGTFPGAAFMGLATVDHFTHAWDLARATGQSTDLDAALAQELLAAARGMISDDLRGPDTVAPFGPEVMAGTAVCPADQLAAFLGRNP
jgi:uncharacterized protein (TIGR03086 family)